ncbi:helix-hairpin-helix domain-containing protein [Nibrella saemangeumensis]|uniref:Helix-hairpin-helix domain-containing protein n=1 Tax=Nibrella saemangeumensis TaxID=1084526 RepID=A0ABP8MX64_9BACT
MKHFYCFLLAAAGLAISLPARPQHFSARPPATRPDALINELLQNLTTVQNEDVDYALLYDALYQLYTNPLNLNTATRDELASTYLLSEQQITSLLTYRFAYGSLLSMYELQAVPDFDLPTIRRLMYFTTIDEGNNSLLNRLPNPANHYLLIRYEQILEKQQGFTPAEPAKNGKLPARYLGDSQQWYVRYRYSRPRAYSFGLTVEKDAGEQMRWQPGNYQYGFDYVSFHGQVQNRGRWRNIIIGDYQLQIGQGLVLSAGFALGKGAETVQSIRRSTLGARPYTSLSEFGYLRGATATYALNRKLDLTLLLASNRRDANIKAATATEQALVTSLLTAGLHRTTAEREDRAILTEQNAGGHLLYHPNTRLQLGLTALHTSFEKNLQKRNLPYNQYEFTGRGNLVAGLHGSYVWQNVNLFGEVARSSGSKTFSGGIGAVGGALVSLSRRLDMALLLRHYDRNFHSFYANAFGEGSRTINESGAYVGIKYSVYRKFSVAGFIDRFRFPWLRYLVDSPSRGHDFLLQAVYTPTKKLSFHASYHEEHKQKNRPGSKTTPKEVTGTTRRVLVLNAEYSPIWGLQLRSRVQWGSFRYIGADPSEGFALIQDASYDRGRWSISGRMAFFGTDDYDSRQYAYERDVLYAFSFPAYNNRGKRQYLMVQYAVNRHLDVWLRWSRTHLSNQQTIGSDLDKINAPHQSEMKVQARWRF